MADHKTLPFCSSKHIGLPLVPTTQQISERNNLLLSSEANSMAPVIEMPDPETPCSSACMHDVGWVDTRPFHNHIV